jgi:hypothetical protein
MKTADLIGPALDWAVATCEGYSLTSDGISLLLKRGKELRILGKNSSSLAYSTSTDWSQGGPIIEREGIAVGHAVSEIDWCSCLSRYAETDPAERFPQEGPTPLIAAMRCYVASKLGAEVDVPEELV